jgi:hypothetical protein
MKIGLGYVTETHNMDEVIGANLSNLTICREAVELAVRVYGRIDILFDNAANSYLTGLINTGNVFFSFMPRYFCALAALI